MLIIFNNQYMIYPLYYVPAMLNYFGAIQSCLVLRVFNTVYILCHVLLLVAELVLANHHLTKTKHYETLTAELDILQFFSHLLNSALERSFQAH